MSTTTTPNLGLIKPTPNTGELMSNWPTQNSTNANLLEGFLKTTQDTFTPNLTGSSSNPTLGSGAENVGKLVVYLDKFVHVWVRIRFGTTGFAAGSGTYLIDVPAAYPLDTTIHSADQALGYAYLRDNSASANSANAICCLDSGSLTKIYLRADTTGVGTLWTPTTPFTLAQQDGMTCYFSYVTTA